MAIVDTCLLPFTLLKQHVRDRRNKILAKRMSRHPEPEPEQPPSRVKQRRKKIGAVSTPTAGYNQRVSKPHKFVLQSSLDPSQREPRAEPSIPQKMPRPPPTITVGMIAKPSSPSVRFTALLEPTMTK